jgi:hypothetical protein
LVTLQLSSCNIPVLWLQRLLDMLLLLLSLFWQWVLLQCQLATFGSLCCFVCRLQALVLLRRAPSMLLLNTTSSSSWPGFRVSYSSSKSSSNRSSS